MAHSWYVWSFNFRNVRVFTAEAVWRAKVEEAVKVMRELEATRRAMEAQIQKVGGACGLRRTHSHKTGMPDRRCLDLRMGASGSVAHKMKHS